MAHAAVIHHRPQLCAGRIHQWRFGGHFHCFLRLAELHGSVEIDDLIDIQRHIFADDLLEAGAFEFDFIGSDRHFGKNVVAAVIGLRAAANAGRLVRDPHRHLREHRPGRVRHAPDNSAPRTLS